MSDVFYTGLKGSQVQKVFYEANALLKVALIPKYIYYMICFTFKCNKYIQYAYMYALIIHSSGL